MAGFEGVRAGAGFWPGCAIAGVPGDPVTRAACRAAARPGVSGAAAAFCAVDGFTVSPSNSSCSAKKSAANPVPDIGVDAGFCAGRGGVEGVAGALCSFCSLKNAAASDAPLAGAFAWVPPCSAKNAEARDAPVSGCFFGSGAPWSDRNAAANDAPVSGAFFCSESPCSERNAAASAAPVSAPWSGFGAGAGAGADGPDASAARKSAAREAPDAALALGFGAGSTADPAFRKSAARSAPLVEPVDLG